MNKVDFELSIEKRLELNVEKSVTKGQVLEKQIGKTEQQLGVTMGMLIDDLKTQFRCLRDFQKRIM